MFLTLQIPLADLRRFAPAKPELSPRPKWPSPVEGDYVRGFGPITARRSGGVPVWGEDSFCDAGKLLSIPSWKFSTKAGVRSSSNNWGTLIADPEDRSYWDVSHPCIRLYCFSKRLFADGQALAKLEIGFLTDRPYQFSWGPQNVRELVLRLLNLKVTIGHGKELDNVKLGSLGLLLRQRYASASSRAGLKSGEELIYPAKPMLTVEHSVPHENINVDGPVGLISVGARLARTSCRFEGVDVPIFVLGKERDYDPTRIRQIRICVQRFHAECECLRRVLHSLDDNELEINRATAQFQELQWYLNRATQHIARVRAIADKISSESARVEAHGREYSRRFGRMAPSPTSQKWVRLALRHSSKQNRAESIVESKSISDLCFSAMEEFWGGRIDSLHQMLETVSVRKNIRAKVEDFAKQVNQLIHVEGNLNMGDQHNTFNAPVGVVASVATGNTVMIGGGQTFVQAAIESGSQTVSSELARLEKALRSADDAADHLSEVELIADARKSVARKDAKKTTEYLAKAGKWAAEVASKIGAHVVEEMIKKSMGA